MILDLQSAFNVLIGIVIAGAAWWAKEIWNALSKLREDLHDIEISLPSHYLRKDEFSDAMKMLNEKLDKIVDKLENKEDRR